MIMGLMLTNFSYSKIYTCNLCYSPRLFQQSMKKVIYLQKAINSILKWMCKTEWRNFQSEKFSVLCCWLLSFSDWYIYTRKILGLIHCLQELNATEDESAARPQAEFSSRKSTLGSKLRNHLSSFFKPLHHSV